MRCPECNTEQSNDVKFCSNCGSKIDGQEQEVKAKVEEDEAVSEEQTAASLETPPSQLNKLAKLSWKPTKKSMVVLGGVVVLVLAVIIGFSVYLSKSPKELYLFSEWRTAQSQVESIEAGFGEEIALQQKLLEVPSTTKTELSGDVTYSGADGDQGFEDFRSVLNDSKISVTTVQDPVNQLTEITLAYLMQETKLFDAIIIQTTESTGLEVPVLLQDMLYVENSEFGEFMETINPYYEGPDQLSQDDYQALLTLSDDEKERLKKEYKSFILGQLDDSYFTLHDKVSYSTPDGAVDLRRIDMSMTEQEVQHLLVKFIDHVRADKELQDIVAQKFVELMTAANKEEDLADLEAFTDVDYIKGEIEDGLYAIKKEIANIEFPKGFNMSVYIDSKEHIVDRTLDLEVEDDMLNMGVAFKLQTSDWTAKDDTQTGNLKVEFASTAGSRQSLTFSSESITSLGQMGQKEDITTNVTLQNNGVKEIDANLDLTIFNAGEQAKGKKTDYEFEFSLDGQSFKAIQPEVKGKLKRIIDQDLGKDFSNQEYQVEFVYGMNNLFGGGKEEFGVKLDITNEVVFSDTIVAPAIKSDAINVSELTDSEWYELQAEMEQSLATFIAKNENIFQFNSMRYD